MPASIEHRARMLAFCEATQTKAAERAKAIFEFVNLCALARSEITNPELKERISVALRDKAHIALDGEFFVDTDNADVVVLAGGGR